MRHLSLAVVFLVGTAMCGVATLAACVGDDGNPVNDAQATDTGGGDANKIDAGAEASGIALTVALDGGGAGSVTSSPTGINCGAQCTSTFATDASVTLTAAADASSS